MSSTSAPLPRFQSKSEFVYAVLKERILSEELPPGAVLSQERMAPELGVSTTPMREALKRLATEGLVVLGSYRDARVSELSAEEAGSLYEVRLRVDPLAAGLAAQRRTAEDLAGVEAALQQLHPLSGRADWSSLTAHREFHRAVYRASHNLPLIEVLEGLWDKADRYRQVGLRSQPDGPSEVERVRAEHTALAAAVAAGDAELAEQVMHDHVAASLGRRAIDSLAAAEAARADSS